MNELVIKEATQDDFDNVMSLYRELHVNDPILTDGTDRQVFNKILADPNLQLFIGFLDEAAVASLYLNVIPNLTRSAAPYAIIENVITRNDLRGQGIGRRMMAFTLQRAWAAGCYKAMLQTGQTDPGVHAFYRSCGFRSDDKTGYVARPSP